MAINLDLCQAITGCCWNCYDRTEGRTNYIANLDENWVSLKAVGLDLIKRKKPVKELIDRGVRPTGADSWLEEKVPGVEQELLSIFRPGGNPAAQNIDVETELTAILGPKGNCRALPSKWLCRYAASWCGYEMGGRVSILLKQIRELTSEADGLQGSVPSTQAPVVCLSGDLRGEMVGMQSKIEEFWRHFQNQNVSFIGIQGAGGTGKSEFLIKINNEFFNDARGFYRVIWIRLPVDPNNIDKIHDHIGERIGLSWPASVVKEKPKGDIQNFLRNKKFLLLLDDLRSGLSFSDIEVPTPDSQNKCKVVFTTREKGLWKNVGVQEMELDPLGQDQARLLFKRSVGEELFNRRAVGDQVNSLADDVADLCDGLPLALVTIGTGIRTSGNADKELESELRRAKDWLSDPTLTSAGSEEEVFRRLCLGYQYLEDNTIHQECFLYCCLFPKDYSVKDEQFAHYWLAEGFFGSDHRTLSVAVNHGQFIVNRLRRFRLLMGSEDQSAVKMHHLTHGMALWIASGRETEDRRDKFFVRYTVRLDELPEEEDWALVKRISLVNTSIDLLNRGDFSNLSTLILNHSEVVNISDDFFKPMKNLKVLDLAWSIVPAFPEGVVELPALQYLNLSHSNIASLPVEFKNLKKLKFLDLSFTEKLQAIPPNVLSSLKALLLLNMYYCGFGGRIAKGSISFGVDNILDEVGQLRHLEDLGVTVKSNSAIEKLKSSLKLSCIHSILIMKCEGMNKLDLSFITSVKTLKELHVIDCSKLASVQLHQTAIIKSCFESLVSIVIKSCQALTDLTWLIYAQALQLLEVDDCKMLEKIISTSGSFGGASSGNQQDPIASIPFSKLKNLYLSWLPELDSICVKDLPFTFLEEITVLYCPKLKTIPLDASNSTETLIIKCQSRWWHQLAVDATIKSRFTACFVG